MTLKLFKDISKDDIRKTYDLRGKIIIVKQTSGPTLMVLNDGTTNFTFKAFIKPGVRAYPECDIGDFVDITAQINERNSLIEGEIRTMIKLSMEEKIKFEDEIIKLNEEKFKPVVDEFTIKSPALEKLKPRFIKVAKIIRQAIVEQRPIILRHNADCDGYSSAITIERAILGFLNEISGGDKMLAYQNYKRAPSKAPFYEYEDAIKDISFWLKDRAKFNVKPPLVIITDNGSTIEDILSIKQMKLYGAKIVVVDHHFPGVVKDGKVSVDEFIDAHINPYLEGFDSNICAGMLGFELANFIYKNNNSVLIPAMAAILDHTEGIEKDQYVEKAIKLGYSETFLANLGEIVDMQSHYLRFQEAREFIDDLFGSNPKLQKLLVEMMIPELDFRYSQVFKVAKKYAKIKEFEKFVLILFDGEKGTLRGQYPAIGKSTNFIHKNFEMQFEKPIVTGTFGSTFLTIRVSDKIKNFSVLNFVKMIKEKIDYAKFDGGGHEHAGSVKFVEYAKNEILEEFEKYLKEI